MQQQAQQPPCSPPRSPLRRRNSSKIATSYTVALPPAALLDPDDLTPSQVAALLGRARSPDHHLRTNIISTTSQQQLQIQQLQAESSGSDIGAPTTSRATPEAERLGVQPMSFGTRTEFTSLMVSPSSEVGAGACLNTGCCLQTGHGKRPCETGLRHP